MGCGIGGLTGWGIGTGTCWPICGNTGFRGTAGPIGACATGMGGRGSRTGGAGGGANVLFVSCWDGKLGAVRQEPYQGNSTCQSPYDNNTSQNGAASAPSIAC